jgi:hypothetical protein
MKTLHLTKKELPIQDFKHRHATEADADVLINEDTLICENGVPVILYKKIDWCDTEQLHNVCKRVKYVSATRIPSKKRMGLTTRSAIFGFRPRNGIRQNYCSSTSFAMKQKLEHGIITDFAKNLMEVYKRYFPEVYAKHEQVVKEKVLPEWIIKDTIFTSGIINHDNPLPYHFDTGNFKGVLSNMVALKRGVQGGRLVLPEYGVKLEIEDNTVTIFDGQSIIHGVTPIVKHEQDAYRYTIVYYSLLNMWQCLPIGDEINYIRKTKMEVEKRRLK